jgi:hypothetical protein
LPQTRQREKPFLSISSPAMESALFNVPGQDGWDHYVIDLSKKINHKIHEKHEKVEGLALECSFSHPVRALGPWIKTPGFFNRIFFKWWLLLSCISWFQSGHPTPIWPTQSLVV